MAIAVEYVPASGLVPMPGNPRNNAKAIKPVADSIKRFGWTNPILARRADSVVVAGHTRLEAAKSLGMDKVPVIWLDLDPVNSRLYNLADNKLAQVAEWDDGALVEMLRELAEEDRAGLAIAGFGEDEVARLIAETQPAPELGEDTEVEPPAEPWVKRGDLFKLGEHRLLCGDCTNEADVALVMAGEKAALCLTDPPYGIGEAYESHDDTRQNLAELILRFLPLARGVASVVALTSGTKNVFLYPPPTWLLAWFVPAGTGAGPWGFACWQPVLVYGKDPYLANGMGSRPDALCKTEAADNSLGHPCSKPVEVWSWFLQRCSASAGDLVYEPFCGSGTTIIACEKHSRRCNAIEIEPKYVQATLERWERLTGKKAEKIDSCPVDAPAN